MTEIEEMNRHEMVKAFKVIFGVDQRFPLTVTTFDNPTTGTIQVNVNIEFGVTSHIKKSDLVKMKVGSKLLNKKGKELREYLCVVMEERVKQWRADDV